METAHNLILAGGTGTGKNPLGHGDRRGSDPSIQTRPILQCGRPGQPARTGKGSWQGRQSGQATLSGRRVILDELGYLPFPASSGALLFHLISQLYEKTSLIICDQSVVQ